MNFSELRLFKICSRYLKLKKVVETPGALSNPFGLGTRFGMSLFLWSNPTEGEVRLVGYDSANEKLSTLGLEILLGFEDEEDDLHEEDELGQVWGCVYYPGGERNIWRLRVTY